jgi:carbon monoxide dehydrogenase subunit G
MASINKEISLAVDADRAWALLRDPGAVHRAFPGVVAETAVEGDLRVVTFANGMVVRERIVDVDDARRRVAYSVIEGGFQHHHASMHIVAEGAGRSRLVWTSDFLPGERAAHMLPLIDAGAEAFQRAAERSA